MSLVAISRARLEHRTAFKRRMGWNFRWVSSRDCDFNFDYHVSFINFESLPREVPPAMPLELPGSILTFTAIPLVIEGARLARLPQWSN